MRFSNIIVVSGLLLLLPLSCTEQVESAEGEGYVDISVARDESLELVAHSRAAEGTGPISLSIYDSRGAMVSHWEDASMVPVPLTLQTGRYRAVASCGQDGGPAVFDSPFYTGEASFVVRKDIMASADITCRLSSVKVTADFAQEIKDNFTYSLAVTNGEGTLVYDTESDGKAGYFSPTGTLSWVLDLTNADNEHFQLNDTYEDVNASQHYAISFSLDLTDEGNIGAGEFEVIVDDSLNDPKVHEVTLVIDKSAPTFTGTDQFVKYIEDSSDDAHVSVSSSLPMSSLVLSHADAALAGTGLPMETELMGLSDLAVFSDAGLIIDIYDGDGNEQTSVDALTEDVEIDFSALADRLAVGKYSFTLTASNQSGKSASKNVTLSILSGFGEIFTDPWAKFIFVKALWLSDTFPSGMKVQYRKNGATEWSDADMAMTSFDQASKTCRAFVLGLDPGTQYDIRLLADKEVSASVSALTEAAEQLYNMNFDSWSKNGDVPYPYASDWSAHVSDPVWDTANGGTSLMNIYPTTEEKSEVVSGSAVRMKSTYASMMGMGKFAAGNIYTGKFIDIQTSPMGAFLDWGVKFNGRPLALKGYYKYYPKPINYVGSGYEDQEGQNDICQVQVALLSTDKPFRIETHNNRFLIFDKSNKDILAHNSIEDRTQSNDWVEFTLSCKYRDVRVRPLSAVVSACASRYGDYFTGGEGSVMLVDEFSFEYDPMALEEEDRTAFFALFNKL